MSGTTPRASLTTEPTGEPVVNIAPSGSVGRFTAINLIGSAVPLIVAILTVPRYLHALGDARYGIWLIAWVLMSYFGLVDLGLGRATANSVAKLRAASATEREAIVWTGVVVNLGFGALAGVLILGCGEIVMRLSGGLGGNLHGEVVSALPWLAATVPLFIVTTVLIGALEGVERFLVVNVAGTLGSVLAQTLPLAAVSVVAPRLNVLAAATTLALVLSTAIAAIACFIFLPMRLRPRFDRARAGPLLRFGGWITVTSLISPLLSTLDKLVVGAVSGARAVTHYTVPFNLVTRLWIFPAALARSLFPRFSRLTDAEARRLANESFRALSATMTPITVVAIIAVHPFMRAWVGQAFASAAALPAEIFLLGLWVNSLAFVPYTFLQAQGRPDLPAKLHVVELLPFLGALWLGIRLAGVAGAAAAWSARVLIDTILLMIAAKDQPRSHVYLLPSAALAVVAFWLAQVTPATISARVFVSAVLVPAALAWSWLVAPPSLRDYVLRFRPRLRILRARGSD